MTEAGHTYSFGAPTKGWPTFGPDGKIVPDEVERLTTTRSEAAPDPGVLRGCRLCGADHEVVGTLGGTRILVCEKVPYGVFGIILDGEHLEPE